MSGGGDDKSYLWRLYDGEQLYEFGGHTDSVTQVAFSTDGTFVASGSMDGKVRVWKSETGEFVCELEGPDEVVVRTRLDWIEWATVVSLVTACLNVRGIQSTHFLRISSFQTSGSTGTLRATSSWPAQRIPRSGCGLFPLEHS